MLPSLVASLSLFTLRVMDSKLPFTDRENKAHAGEEMHPKPPRTRTQACQALKPQCPWPPQGQQSGFFVTGEAPASWISGQPGQVANPALPVSP